LSSSFLISESKHSQISLRERRSDGGPPHEKSGLDCPASDFSLPAAAGISPAIMP
jgi:hypothetical protein